MRAKKIIGYVFVLWISGLIATMMMPMIFFKKGIMDLLIAMISGGTYIILTNSLFRILYKFKYGVVYQILPKIPFTKIYIEPHPYLPYVCKKDFIIDNEHEATYPLHEGKYVYPSTKTNNYRHISGPQTGREVVTPKPQNLIRINCLGDSTTALYIGRNGKIFSYPSELERRVKDRYSHCMVEVNNFAMGGWSTAELLVSFLLKGIDSDPDILIFHNGIRDIEPSLIPNYDSDYSHARRNLGEVYQSYRFGAWVPHFNFSLYNFFTTKILKANIRFDLLSAIRRADERLDGNFNKFFSYQRNLEHIINVCKCNNIDVILSTLPTFIYATIKDCPFHKKYDEGIKQENDILRILADKHRLTLVDNDLIMPRDEMYYLDYIHLTPEGMMKLSENMVEAVITCIDKRRNR